jgi:hypothetical protein
MEISRSSELGGAGFQGPSTRAKEDGSPLALLCPSRYWSYNAVTDNGRTAMKNADEMLKKIMDAVDTNGDGKIQYEGTHERREV